MIPGTTLRFVRTNKFNRKFKGIAIYVNKVMKYLEQNIKFNAIASRYENDDKFIIKQLSQNARILHVFILSVGGAWSGGWNYSLAGRCV